MTFRALIVGDVHATVEDLADCDALSRVVMRVAEEQRPDAVVVLGDLYDSFALKNVVVERWWMRFLEALPRGSVVAKPVVIVGNHDRPGDSSQDAHALQAHSEVAVVVDRPRLIVEHVAAMPFYFRADDFVDAARGVGDARTLLCHQSFIGGKYDSGLPIEQKHDPSAVDPAVVPQGCVISGHVHATQYVAKKVWYPGSPRWRNNVSDANVERYVYLVTFVGGVPRAVKKFQTGNDCRRIWRVEDVEGAPPPVVPGKAADRVVVDITGSAAYVERRRPQWVGARVRAFFTDRPSPKLSEALGMGAAWVKWGETYQPKYGTPVPELVEMLRERIV